MNISLPNLQDVNVKGKKVFVRCDFDVPLNKDSKIIDDTRLISGVSTVEYLIEEGATVIAAGHLGRPSGKDKKFSLEPVIKWYEEQFGQFSKKTLIGSFEGWEINKNFYILENLRFFNGEEEGDREFSKRLAKLSDIYVNEAFGASHRSHASIVGVPRYLPSFAGFHFIKETKILSRILNNPKRPLTVIIGGAKIDTKLPMVSSMHSFADYVLVGGEIAEKTKILMHESHRVIMGQKAELIVAELNEEKTDITRDSLDKFIDIIKKSNMIVWNGPMGFIEEGRVRSTSELSRAIVKTSGYKVVGGGDTIGYLNKQNLLKKFDFVSMGGGAMLEYLSGVELPGIKALQTNT